MKKVVFVFAVLVAFAIALGFFMEWFRLSTNRDHALGKTHIGLTIDEVKIRFDVSQVVSKVKGNGSSSGEAAK